MHSTFSAMLNGIGQVLYLFPSGVELPNRRSNYRRSLEQQQQALAERLRRIGLVYDPDDTLTVDTFVKSISFDVVAKSKSIEAMAAMGMRSSALMATFLNDPNIQVRDKAVKAIEAVAKGEPSILLGLLAIDSADIKNVAINIMKSIGASGADMPAESPPLTTIILRARMQYMP